MKAKFKQIGHLIVEIYTNFTEDGVMGMAASLAYYTIFSLVPILFIIIFTAGLILEKNTVQEEVYREISNMLGPEASLQLQESVARLLTNDSGFFPAILGIVTLIIGATTVFVSMQESLNRIWKVRPKPKYGFLKLVLDRLTSFGMVLGFSFVLLVSMAFNALIAASENYLITLVADWSIVFIQGTAIVFSFVITSFVFGFIFKALPDARISWKDVSIGAIVTGILFTIGKFGIGLYLGNSNVASIYGAAASIMIVLLWVYYSAVIMYMGAEFTYAYAHTFGSKIRPSSFAVKYIRKEIELPKGKKKAEEEEIEEKIDQKIDETLH